MLPEHEYQLNVYFSVKRIVFLSFVEKELMSFQRIVSRGLPDGTIAKVFPFHISLEGLERNLLCREEEDYGVMEKFLFVSAWESNCLIVIHIIMSNHGHACVLAPSWENAYRMSEFMKKRSSMFIAGKYNEHHVLSRTKACIQLLDTDWYVRNTLAYIPRNAKDTGWRIEDYPWSGYRGMFVGGRSSQGIRKVSLLTRREKESLFHTHANLERVPWLLDRDNRLVPASCCDWEYLESAFNHDEAFFLKTIGTVNPAEMEQKLLHNLKERQTDSAFLVTVEDLSGRWFQKTPTNLTLEQKTRLLPYLYRSYRTTVGQLARCLREDPQTIERIIRKR